MTHFGHYSPGKWETIPIVVGNVKVLKSHQIYYVLKSYKNVTTCTVFSGDFDRCRSPLIQGCLTTLRACPYSVYYRNIWKRVSWWKYSLIFIDTNTRCWWWKMEWLANWDIVSPNNRICSVFCFVSIEILNLSCYCDYT